ncbi:hypothetical protein HDV00_002463 [Rhizophlyctis rosea]|nr:hypothetical protein HDV00_002463 [Rhizophlyctis rosea]
MAYVMGGPSNPAARNPRGRRHEENSDDSDNSKSRGEPNSDDEANIREKYYLSCNVNFAELRAGSEMEAIRNIEGETETTIAFVPNQSVLEITGATWDGVSAARKELQRLFSQDASIAPRRLYPNAPHPSKWGRRRDVKTTIRFATQDVRDEPDHFPSGTALPPPEEVSDESDYEYVHPTPSAARATSPNEGLPPDRVRPWHPVPGERLEDRANRKRKCKERRSTRKKQRMLSSALMIASARGEVGSPSSTAETHSNNGTTPSYRMWPTLRTIHLDDARRREEWRSRPARPSNWSPGPSSSGMKSEEVHHSAAAPVKPEDADYSAATAVKREDADYSAATLVKREESVQIAPLAVKAEGDEGAGEERSVK